MKVKYYHKMYVGRITWQKAFGIIADEVRVPISNTFIKKVVELTDGNIYFDNSNGLSIFSTAGYGTVKDTLIEGIRKFAEAEILKGNVCIMSKELTTILTDKNFDFSEVREELNKLKARVR